MTNQVTWTDDAGNIYNANATHPLPVTTSGGATQAVGGDAASGAADSGNPVKIGFRYNSTLPTVTNGQRVDGQATARGEALVSISSGGLAPNVNAGNANADGQASGYALYTSSYCVVYNGTNWDRMRGDVNGSYTVPKPVTSGGLLISRLIAATNGVIKASAGQLYGGTLTNTNAAIRYLQIYNKATAGTLSTDTPVLTIPLPPNATVMLDSQVMGIACSTGMSWQFTTDDVAIPTTAGASTDIHGFITYK